MKSLRNLSMIAVSIASALAIVPSSHAGEVNVACTNAYGRTTYTAIDIPFVNVPALNVATGTYNPNYCKVRPAYSAPYSVPVVQAEPYRVQVNTAPHVPTVRVIEVSPVAPTYTIRVTPDQDLW
jgi:hypothetical protein